MNNQDLINIVKYYEIKYNNLKQLYDKQTNELNLLKTNKKISSCKNNLKSCDEILLKKYSFDPTEKVEKLKEIFSYIKKNENVTDILDILKLEEEISKFGLIINEYNFDMATTQKIINNECILLKD